MDELHRSGVQMSDNMCGSSPLVREEVEANAVDVFVVKLLPPFGMTNG